MFACKFQTAFEQYEFWANGAPVGASSVVRTFVPNDPAECVHRLDVLVSLFNRYWRYSFCSPSRASPVNRYTTYSGNSPRESLTADITNRDSHNGKEPNYRRRFQCGPTDTSRTLAVRVSWHSFKLLAVGRHVIDTNSSIEHFMISRAHSKRRCRPRNSFQTTNNHFVPNLYTQFPTQSSLCFAFTLAVYGGFRCSLEFIFCESTPLIQSTVF